jgi:hypothetical protein
MILLDFTDEGHTVPLIRCDRCSQTIEQAALAAVYWTREDHRRGRVRAAYRAQTTHERTRFPSNGLRDVDGSRCPRSGPEFVPARFRARRRRLSLRSNPARRQRHNHRLLAGRPRFPWRPRERY